MPGYDLAYVALAVRDAAAAARFLGDSLGLPRTDLDAGGHAVPAFAVGPTALVLFDPDDPFLDAPARPGVHHIGLAAADPAATARRHELPTVMAGRGLGGAEQAVLPGAATCGIRTRFTTPLGLSGGTAAVPRLDHLGIASADNKAAIRAFVDTLGCALESQQTDLQILNAVETFTSDKYPVVHHNQPAQVIGGLRDTFITVGDCELEFLQDFDPNLTPRQAQHHKPGDTKGDQSAIAAYVAKYGPGLHHIAFKATDIDALLPRLAAEGWRMLDTAGRPGGRASRIGFVHPANFGGGLLVHFVERVDPDRDPA